MSTQTAHPTAEPTTPETESGHALSLHNVTFGYDASSPVLKHIHLTLDRGLILLLGPNGHGKSTLLKLLAGVERPDQGHVTVGGHDMWQDEEAARRLLAYVPEHPDITPYASVRDVLELTAWLREGTLDRVEEVLKQVGLNDTLAKRSIRRLSKGQRRRAMLAAAFLGRPPVLLMDEPLDALDRNLRNNLCERLKKRVDDGGLVIVVTHEIEPFAPWAGAAVGMSHGQATAIRDLPDDIDARNQIFEKLARGEDL